MHKKLITALFRGDSFLLEWDEKIDDVIVWE